MDVRRHNRMAWDREVERGNCWTVPVSREAVEEARSGRWQIVLTPTKPVPNDWFPELTGADVLCLASGGGQQGPILAAAGANVTVFDNSPRQLAQDRAVADRDGLTIRTCEGDMAALTEFEDAAFDLVVHPISNTFVTDVRPVWREAFRVLRRGGSMLAGFINPAVYLFDYERAKETNDLRVAQALPYSDAKSLGAEKRRRILDEQRPLEHRHTLADQIGGQIAAGFHIVGFYEDRPSAGPEDLLEAYMDTCIATRAVKP